MLPGERERENHGSNKPVHTSHASILSRPSAPAIMVEDRQEEDEGKRNKKLPEVI